MHIPILIGGGGIIGLLFYYELQKKLPKLECALLEASPFFGDMATGRNSGVLHAGLYYDKGSLKHRLCLEGNKAWTSLADELGITINQCGKFVVATAESEVAVLQELYGKAQINEVPLLRKSTSTEIKELSRWCFHRDSFYSGSTKVISPSQVVSALVRRIEGAGGILMRGHAIKSVRKSSGKLFVKTNHGEFSCDYFINACGGFAPEVRKTLGLVDVDSYWVKGSYLKLKKKFYHDSLIYPVPPQKLIGLGVHTSFDHDGVIRFGPDTAPCESYEHSLNDKKREEMHAAIKTLFKGIKKEELDLDYCGIRSKIKWRGELYRDFWIGGPQEHGLSGYLEYLGIESPGLTSAPALVREGLDRLQIRG